MRKAENIEKGDNCRTENRAELEDKYGVQSFLWINENEITGGNGSIGMLEQVLSTANLHRALEQVVRNKGASGVDKMKTTELKEYVVKHFDKIRQTILSGKYKSQPVRRVAIPKNNGKKRQLGIPTVIDRLIQQSINRILTPIYERQFSDDSFGFRPHRSAHQALKRVEKYVDEGYHYVVDMDLEKYFDTVNRSKLVEVMSRTIKDGRIITLIHKFLNAGVQVGTRIETPEAGIPQGSPLSPLLGNIMLNELDKELRKRGHKFVRYADDMIILCKSKRAGERTLASTTKYIESKLYLRVNREKTVVANISEVKFLGYSFYIKDNKCRFGLHSVSKDRMKQRLRDITSRSNGRGDVWRKQTLSYYIRGWSQYFRYADMKSYLQKIDAWLRRRIRMCIWKQWKRIKTKIANLRKLGMSKQKAYEYGNTRKGYWHIANSWILSTTITNARLQKAGYIFLSDCYKSLTTTY
jgi:group II intron reverse transcriptase/maturase